MSYLAQDESQFKKAGAGMINILIAVGAAIGIYYMTRNKKKTTKRGYSKRKHHKAKVRPLPR